MAEHSHFLNNGRFQEPQHEMEWFERGLKLREQVGDARGLAESYFHVGLVHQVVCGDSVAGKPFFERSYELAKEANDAVMQSYAIRPIAFVRGDGGDAAAALDGLRESLALREQAGFMPGVAMALFALGENEMEYGDRNAAREHLEKAKALLVAMGATRRVDRIEQALANLDGG